MRRYEASTRNRRTILNRAGQLLDERPRPPVGAMELARPARADDRQACTRLLSHALVAAEAMRGGAALVGDATTVTLLDRWTAARRHAHLLVGEYSGVVVGLLAVTAAPGPGPHERTRRVLLRGDRCTRVGVGTALMDAAVAWCIERGCSNMDALALPGDRTTKQRLEAAGFSARLLTLSRRLD